MRIADLEAALAKVNARLTQVQAEAVFGVQAYHPMRDGYAGSAMSSGPEGPHKLAVFYDTREQADAAQAWLAAGVKPSDGGQR